MVDHSPGHDLGLEGWIAFELYRTALRDGLRAGGFTDLREADGPILRYLHHAGSSTVGELAEAFGVSKQAASQAVASLVERGYGERTPDAEDRRSRVVSLNERGEAAHAAAVDVAEREEARLVEIVGTDALAGWRSVNRAMRDAWLDRAPDRVRIAVAMSEGRDPT
jgi:DNA-binding MarR family transcriptional regulator